MNDYKRIPGRVRTRAGRRWTGLILCTLLLISMIQPAVAQEQETGQPNEIGGSTFRVFAHPEGLVGHTTANGHVIQPDDFFVALPCFCVLSSRGGDEFQVRVEYNGTSLVLPVWDVGPWNVEDNYWDPSPERTWSDLPRGLPQAEAAFYQDYNDGLDGWGRTILSPAGMDIADGAFAALGMTSSDWVNVTFLWLESEHQEVPDLPAAFSDIPTVYPDQRPPLEHFVERIDDGRFGYIPETGHNVPVQLLEYWYATGGWWFHGLPVSEFYREVLADGTVRYVQHFERTVLSIDLSGETSPPRVTAEKLGYSTYIDPDARAIVEVFEPNPHFTFFPETGHTVAHGFKALFEAHGGVEVFGYPLSEEWSTIQPDGRKVVFQVFERARFEWWPDRVGHGDEITLGLLTIERLQRQGLLP